MKTIEVDVQGLSVFVSEISLKPYFQCNSEEWGTFYYGPRKGEYGLKKETTNLYQSLPRKGFHTGLGAISWLNNRSNLINFKINSVTPFRGSLKPFKIPSKITQSPKFQVNGKDRYYFHEALKACRIKPMGAVKLPTGSGKTEIAITLSYNQLDQLGSGLIIAPTLAIKDQFTQRAKKYGIEVISYSDWSDLNVGEPCIIIDTHHSIQQNLISKNKDKKERAKKFLHSINWVIWDECHHISCKSWYNIVINLTNCQRSHGFSAMPTGESASNASSFDNLEPADARVLSVLGSVIYEKSAHELREFLNLPELINLDYKWPEGASSFQRATSWKEARAAMLSNDHRIEFIAKILSTLVSQGYKVCTFVNQKNLAYRLMLEAKNKKLCAWFGGGVALLYKDKEVLTKKKYSDTLREEFGKSIFGLILTSHGIEGLDLDDPINIALLQEGKSSRQIIQEVGRTVRIDDKCSIIINLWESGCNIFPKHSKERSKIIREEFACSPISCLNTKTLYFIINDIQQSKNL